MHILSDVVRASLLRIFFPVHGLEAKVGLAMNLDLEQAIPAAYWSVVTISLIGGGIAIAVRPALLAARLNNYDEYDDEMRRDIEFMARVTACFMGMNVYASIDMLHTHVANCGNRWVRFVLKGMRLDALCIGAGGAIALMCVDSRVSNATSVVIIVWCALIILISSLEAVHLIRQFCSFTHSHHRSFPQLRL